MKGFAKEAQRLGFIVIGNAIIALGFCCFINPNGFLAGGIYGLAGILRYFAPSVPFPLAVLLFNIPCIIWGYIELRRAFILRSAVGIVAQTIFLAIFPSFVPTYTNDPLLSAIVGGVVAGAGIGIAMRCFSATGGMDIAAMIMKKKFSTSVGLSLIHICFLLFFFIAQHQPSLPSYEDTRLYPDWKSKAYFFSLSCQTQESKVAIYLGQQSF